MILQMTISEGRVTHKLFSNKELREYAECAGHFGFPGCNARPDVADLPCFVPLACLLDRASAECYDLPGRAAGMLIT